MLDSPSRASLPVAGSASVATSGGARPVGDGLPAPFDALDVAMAAALAAVEDADAWDARTRQAAMARVRRHLDAGAALNLKLVAAEQAAGTWGLKGDRDMAGFLGRESHQGRFAGASVVGQAATLNAMPIVAGALVDGPVTVTHVEQIARATAVSPRLAAELATPTGQARLIEMARRFDGAAFGKELKAVGAGLDPVARQREHDQQRAERYLHVSHGPHGTHVKGFLDAVSGYRFVKAIEALDPRPAQDDDRDRGQRWADALVTMADHVLRDKQTTPGAVVPPQVIVTVSEETWTSLRGPRSDAGTTGVPVAGGRASRTPAKGSTVDVVAALQGRTAVVDEDGNAWPASEVARLLCECDLTRVVLGAESQVLDLGYRERCFDRRHWKALLAVGWRTCAYPGCSMPLRWCQLHHLTWWSRDGRTNWDNLGPYCCFHHGVIHDRDIRIRRLPDGGYEHSRPDGSLVGTSRPHRPDAPPGGGGVRGDPAGGGMSRGSPPREAVSSPDAGREVASARFAAGTPVGDGLPGRSGSIAGGGAPSVVGVPGRDRVLARAGQLGLWSA